MRRRQIMHETTQIIRIAIFNYFKDIQLVNSSSLKALYGPPIAWISFLTRKLNSLSTWIYSSSQVWLFYCTSYVLRVGLEWGVVTAHCNVCKHSLSLIVLKQPHKPSWKVAVYSCAEWNVLLWNSLLSIRVNYSSSIKVISRDVICM
jgi:hypothetical protein